MRYWALNLIVLFSVSGCPDQGLEPGPAPGTTGAAGVDVEADSSAGLDTTPGRTDTGGTAPCGTAPSSAQPFPATQLGVRILSPTGLPGFQYPGGTATVGGVAFGDVTSLNWRLGDETGAIVPVAAYWQTGGIPLQPGDNRITVTATSEDGSQTATDSVVISSAPSPVTGLQMSLTPGHAWVGSPRAVRMSLSVPVGEVQADQVNLYRVKENGADWVPLDVHKMRDDGVTDAEEGDCDAIAGDRVFSVCRPIDTSASGRACFRVKVQLPGGVVTTPTECVEILPRITQNDCIQMKQALAQTVEAYNAAGSHDDGLNAALLEALESSEADVATAGRASGGYGVWLQFQNGVVAAAPLGVPSGFRASSVGSHRVLLARTSPEGNEVEAIASELTPETCPPFEPTGPLVGDQADLAHFRGLGSYGVIAFSGHGGAYFDGAKSVDDCVDDTVCPDRPLGERGTQEVWWTGEAVDCSAFLDHSATCGSDSDCPADAVCAVGECVLHAQADLALQRLVLGSETYGIAPSFVAHYGGNSLANSLVYAGACYSAETGSMAMAFLGAGAGAYVGYDGLVSESYAQASGSTLFASLENEKATLDEAICYGTDPERETTHIRRFGNGSLSLEHEGIFSAGFETPSLSGWGVAGDGRAVTSFCGQTPPEGKFMGLISTGLGFTNLAGSLSQRFCIPEGTQTLQFSWRYYSAELELSCNVPGFQDRWKVTLSRDGTNETPIHDCTVTDMCRYDAPNCTPLGCPGPPSDCDCGDCYEPYALAEECQFSGQPVMATDFVVTQFNVSSFAGQGPVTLTFSVKDGGQPTLDTAIILDDVRLQ